MIPQALLLSLFIRSLSLLLPQTFFQPDEYYQVLEPAHHLIFGTGYLTWEWRDLPHILGDTSWWNTVVVGGRMRGWIWPGVFACVYKFLDVLHLDDTSAVVFAPRIVGVLVAAFTDFATYRLARKVFGPGGGAGALFLSLTSLFHAHLLPRSLSNSPETLLTTLALTYFPLGEPEVPRDILVGKEKIHVSPSMRDVRPATSEAGTPPYSGVKEKNKEKDKDKNDDVITLDGPDELNYVVMDRMAQSYRDRIGDNLALSAGLATLAVCIRPTTLPLWGYLGVEYSLRSMQRFGFSRTMGQIIAAVISSLAVFTGFTALDYAITGRLMIPTLTFINQNLLQNISSFYGSTNTLYHLTQSLPIVLFPLWWWWIKGFLAALLPSASLPRSLAHMDRPAPLRLLARAMTFSITVLSLSPHSEWRFLHPFLPSLLLFALPPLWTAYIPIMGPPTIRRLLRQYTRIPKRPFYIILFAPILPYLYLNIFHGRAQVSVMKVLRRGELGEVNGLVVLMPCHSTPWGSHLHKDIPAWFLTCEPPLGINPAQYKPQDDIFYDSPIQYLTTRFPQPPKAMTQILGQVRMEELPSHIILFGEVLDRGEIDSKLGEVRVKDQLIKLGYVETWRAWNGFDILQDDERKRGGVRIWSLP